MNASAVIPVVLFAYARPLHLKRVLACLRENQVPLICAFADGAKGAGDAVAVEEVRALLQEVKWCELHLVRRDINLGLGRNVLAGVGEVAAQHGAFIVWEDDLICVPGTYTWMSAALRRYEADPKVMSVSGWTHPRVTPADVGERPYFDGRAECWVWGSWARAWRGMSDQTATEKMVAAIARGVPAAAYGMDLPAMAAVEQQKNIWAVRWLYHHLQQGGLCLRPPWSMVEHIGFDTSGTNAAAATEWANPPLRSAPPVPVEWLEPCEHPACRRLWAATNPGGWRQRWGRLSERFLEMKPSWRVLVRSLVPVPWLRQWRRHWGWRWFRGDFPVWSAARAAAAGYDDAVVLDRVLAATRAVNAGQAGWERDGVVFIEPQINAPLVTALREAARDTDGPLTVVDFGGSLGSTWWQHRHVLPDLTVVRWKVVEQPHYVKVGAEFTDDRLSFHETLAGAQGDEEPRVILLSGVLPYLESPVALLEEIARRGFRHVIIDRTPLACSGLTKLVVQHTPPELGGGSYPCWLFGRAELLAPLDADYELVAEWSAIDDLALDVVHRGFHFFRKQG